jgi:D-alanyl-D-alanine carboxypeptidase
MLNRILDGCMLVAESGRRIVACNSLDLDGEEMIGLFVAPSYQRQGIGRRLVTEIERLAIRFGMTHLRVDAVTSSMEFFRSCRYEPRTGAAVWEDPRIELDVVQLDRRFPQRQTRYGARIRRLLGKIGIPVDYGRIHRLPLQQECRELATIGLDARGREQMLLPEAAMAWYTLRNAAEEDGITLQVASAFRSVGYQASIIERKRQAGQTIGEILRVSAAPGFSEHHTGCAIDIATPGSTPLEECFESTPAFEWLTEAACEHGFRMSYPRNNRHGIAYEPWHWAWTGR